VKPLRVRATPQFDARFRALDLEVRTQTGHLIQALRSNPYQPEIMDMRWTRLNAAGQCETTVASGHRLLWSIEEAIRVWDVLDPRADFAGVGWAD
jgi:hypothetical protein